MDTMDHALTKLTQLHDESHPTPHWPASLRRNYSLPVESIMELAMEEVWWWWRRKPPYIWSPKRTPDMASRWRTGGDGSSVSWNEIILPPWFFSGNMWFYSVGFRVSGATRWGQPTWARLEGVAHPGGLCPPRCPPPVVLGSRYFLLLYKKSSQSLVPLRELLFLHKNNNMVVLLKTTSVRVSFIQIMQIRVQNKRKSVRKSRYIGDVSAPASLNLCLSSSNSVDKLKVKKKNFYKLFCSCLHK